MKVIYRWISFRKATSRRSPKALVSEGKKRKTSNSIAHLPHVSFQFVYVISSQLSASKLCVGRSLDFIKGLVEGKEQDGLWCVGQTFRKWLKNEYYQVGTFLTPWSMATTERILRFQSVGRREVRHRFPTKQRINGQSHHRALRFQFWPHETLKPLFKARCAPKILQVAVLWKITNDMWVMWVFHSSAWMLQYSTVMVNSAKSAGIIDIIIVFNQKPRRFRDVINHKGGIVKISKRL